MLDRITARSTECRLLLQTSWCSVVCLLVTTVNPAKRLNRSRCFLAAHSCGSEETLLGGVDIVATWRIRWIDLCDGDAGCHYYYCSNLFILPSCSNVFFYPGFAVVWIYSVLKTFCSYDLSVLRLQAFDTAFNFPRNRDSAILTEWSVWSKNISE